MSLKLYTGRQGSGKSYEVCSVVILNALRVGRRVVSNIAGLNFSEYRRILEAEGVAPDKIGSIVCVTHEQVFKPNFWLTDEKLKKQQELDRLIADKSQEPDAATLLETMRDQVEAVIRPGDLVALDEIWRFWSGFAAASEGLSRPADVMNFFRMHRHFIHPVSGVACDVILITQIFSDVTRAVLGVVEENYYMEKLIAVGAPSRYRVDVHAGGKRFKSNLLNSFQRSYNPDYFCLYSSHSLKQDGDAGAVELNADDRANLLRGWWPPTFKTYAVIALFLFVIGFAVISVLKVFKPKNAVPVDAASGQSVAASGVAAASSVVPVQVVSLPSDSDKWRVVGWYNLESELVAVLQSDLGRIRLIHKPEGARFDGEQLDVVLEDKTIVTPYSGGLRGAGDGQRLGR